MRTIETFHRVSVFGHTRSGKSVGIRHLLWMAASNAQSNPHYQIFILWTKIEASPLFTPKHFPGCSVALVNSVREVLKPRARVVICKPPMSEKNEYGFEEYFGRIYYRSERTLRPATVYVDEVNHVTEYKANGGPFSFRRCYTEGAGMKLGVWAGCQDPVFLQREMLSQQDHLLVFRVQRPKDRKLLSEEIGLPLPRKYPHAHGFYHSTGDSDPVYYQSIQYATGREVVL